MAIFSKSRLFPQPARSTASANVNDRERNNQIHRVRVREVRIHPPPAESQQTFGSASSLELQNRVQHQEATNPPIVAKTHSGGLPASPRSRRFGLVDNEQ